MIAAGSTGAVMGWFGKGFDDLHPLLRALHERDSELNGPVTLRFGRGMAGAFGRHMARKLGMPVAAGQHHMNVTIRHDARTLEWHRCFDGTHHLHSSFIPSGHWPAGHWTEKTGALELMMTVDVIEGGWYWRLIAARFHGIRVPLWLIPRSTGYKRIEEGAYRFHVAFSLPILGEVICYSGVLEPSHQE
jgi:hypothetical protein